MLNLNKDDNKMKTKEEYQKLNLSARITYLVSQGYEPLKAVEIARAEQDKGYNPSDVQQAFNKKLSSMFGGK